MAAPCAVLAGFDGPRRCLGRAGSHGADAGVALLAVLLVAVLVGAIGTAIALVADTDTVIAAAAHDGVVGRNAAEAVAGFVVHELSTIPDWTSLLRGGVGSRFAGSLRLPASAGGTSVSLSDLTDRLQGVTYGGDAWGANTPRWRPFGWGVPDGDLPFPGLPSETLVIAWVADDASEADGDPTADTNGILILRVRAMGPGAARTDVTVALRRVAPGIAQVTSWRVSS